MHPCWGWQLVPMPAERGSETLLHRALSSHPGRISIAARRHRPVPDDMHSVSYFLLPLGACYRRGMTRDEPSSFRLTVDEEGEFRFAMCSSSWPATGKFAAGVSQGTPTHIAPETNMVLLVNLNRQYTWHLSPFPTHPPGTSPRPCCLDRARPTSAKVALTPRALERSRFCYYHSFYY